MHRENWHEFYSESFDRYIIMVYIRGYAALSHMKEKKTSSIRLMFRCAKRHIGSLMIQLADMHFSMPFSVFAVEELVSNREKMRLWHLDYILRKVFFVALANNNFVTHTANMADCGLFFT